MSTTAPQSVLIKVDEPETFAIACLISTIRYLERSDTPDAGRRIGLLREFIERFGPIDF